MLSNFYLDLTYSIIASLVIAFLSAIISYCTMPLKNVELLGDKDKVDDNAIMYLNIDLVNIYYKKINKLIRYYKRAYAVSCFMRTLALMYLFFAMFLTKFIPSTVSVYKFLAISSFSIAFIFGFGTEIRKAIIAGEGRVRDIAKMLKDYFSELKYEYEVSSEKQIEYEDRLREEKKYFRFLIFNFRKIDTVVKCGFYLAFVFLLLTVFYSSSSSSKIFIGNDPDPF